MSGTEQGQEIAVAVDDSGVITHFGKARAFHVYTTQGDAKREDTAEVAKVLPITETVCTRHSMGFEEETKPERLARALDLIGGYGTLIVGAIGPPARAGLE
jgi:predicted Fe-Mo cluster-binding NifX family protein